MGGPALGSLSSYQLPNAPRPPPDRMELRFGATGIDHAMFSDVELGSLNPRGAKGTTFLLAVDDIRLASDEAPDATRARESPLFRTVRRDRDAA
mmetsp:Transcript_13018/g.26932  ORF Transcript_13018/g.26932 Transcript_13018/m.26932 type:complete len:94 (+) Transcript_13018:300-581(+)